MQVTLNDFGTIAMQVTLSDFGTILTAVFTGIYTIGTFLLWHSTKKTTLLLSRQLQNQVAANISVAHHAVIDAHRSLYLEVIRDPAFLKIFAHDMGVKEDQARTKLLATLLINQALRIFWDYKENIADHKGIEGFRRDAQDLFSLPFIRERWEEVKKYHSPEFRSFIDSMVLG